MATDDHSWILPQAVARGASTGRDDVLVEEIDGRSQTYGELHHDGMRWAEALQAHGVETGETVVAMLRNSLEVIHAWLGIAWLRALMVPINTMYKGQMLEYVINNSLARVMFVSGRYLPDLATVAPQLRNMELVVVVDDFDHPGPWPFDVVALDTFLRGTRGEAHFPPPSPHDISCIIYTSGTTGPSKGVLVPWREFYEFVNCNPPEMSVRGGPRLCYNPMFHVSGLSGIAVAVDTNIKVVLRETFSVTHFWDDIERYDIESTPLISAAPAMLLGDERYVDPDNPLRAVTMGPVIPNLDEFRERFGIEFVNTGYGMTEIGMPLAATADEMPSTASCGRVRPGYHLRIIDEDGAEVGVGVVGELIVETDDRWMMNAGYWDMPEATDKAWKDGWFHTGDAFKRDDLGFYYFVDRFKDALRRRGENISSFEVERYVLEHPDVAEVAAVAAPSDLGEDDLKVVVVRRPGSPLSHEDLHAFLRGCMPRFMTPRYIEFVDALPKTPTDRVKKVDLRARPLDENTWDSERDMARRSR